jgi:hypothetical protein
MQPIKTHQENVNQMHLLGIIQSYCPILILTKISEERSEQYIEKQKLNKIIQTSKNQMAAEC